MPKTNELAFDLMDQGRLRHYAFVLDGSAKAVGILRKHVGWPIALPPGHLRSE